MGAESLGYLESLDLEGCLKITDVTVEHLAKAFLPINTLILSYVPQITDKAIAIIGEKMKMISTLSLRSCENLTDEALSSLGSCMDLKNLDVRSCWKIPQKALDRLNDNVKAHQHDDEVSFTNFMGLS